MYAPVSSILAVGFVTWGFVAAGLAAVSIPIIIHILNRRRFKTVTWAAMEFLLRAMKKNRRRLRFEQWLLLATRCMVLLLLGMALARPLGCENPTMALMGGRSGVSVFVIDNSYSMAYEVNRPGGRTHLDNAKRIAKDLVDRAARDGGVAVIVASSPAHAIVARPSYDPQDVKSAIDRIDQSYAGTDLPGALQLALQIARENDRQPDKSLELFTDSTNSAWRNPEQAEAMKQLGPEVARAFHVAHHNLSGGGEPQSNGAVLSVRPQDNLVTSKFPADFAALPRGYGSVADASIQWKLNEQPLATDGPIKLTSDTREIPRTNVKFAEGGPQVVSVSLAGGSRGDRLSVDDTRWRVVDVASELNVLIVEGRQGVRPGEGSGFFLREALSPPRESGPAGVAKTDSYVAADSISVIEFGNKVLDNYAAVMLCDVGQIAPTQAEQLERFVRRGGTLFWFMGEQVVAQSYNDMLLPRKLIPGALVKQVRVGTNEKGYLFDFDPKRMPYLRAFENQENTGLETVEVFTYWQTEVPQDGSVQTVLRYHAAKGPPATAPSAAPASAAGKGAGDAAITVHALGNGKVIFCTTSANQDWTTFPGNLSYVTVMHELLTSTVRTGDWWLNLRVGDAVQIPPGVRLTATPTLTDPAGRAVEIRATSGADAGPTGALYKSDPLRRPGVYSLQVGTRRIPVAVNVPDDEADVRTLPDAAIKESLGGVDVALLGPELPPDAALNDTGNDLSWAFMLAVLGLLAVECVMAMRFGHYRRAAQVPAETAVAGKAA
jgi:hypothetical protein